MAFEEFNNSQHCNGEPNFGKPLSEKSNFDENKCPICLSSPQNNKSKPDCGHVFCFECLKRWSKINLECPVCKQSFTSFIHSIESPNEHQVYTPITDKLKCRRCFRDFIDNRFPILFSDGNYLCFECLEERVVAIPRLLSFTSVTYLD